MTTAPRKSKGSKEPVIPAQGPITLRQARLLAAAKSQAKIASRTVMAPAPASVADLRHANLEEARRRKDERERRIREYTAILTIMKRRGVKGLEPAATTRPTTARAGGRQGGAPLQILAEGDSWFDYPVPFFGGSIVPRLEHRIGVPILNLADAGDEVRFMLGVEQRETLRVHLTTGCPAGGSWDVLLFSGGGNDIVGNPMALWILDYQASKAPADLVHVARFGAALDLIRAGYEDLIALRDKLSPGTHLVFHNYDYPIPDGRGICGMGPWLKPALDLHKFPSEAKRVAVVKAMLQRFAEMLDDVAQAHANVTVIHTQGTLATTTLSWHNELHPSKGGFNQIADLFRDALRKQFPDRVL